MNSLTTVGGTVIEYESEDVVSSQQPSRSRVGIRSMTSKRPPIMMLRGNTTGGSTMHRSSNMMGRSRSKFNHHVKNVNVDDDTSPSSSVVDVVDDVGCCS